MGKWLSNGRLCPVAHQPDGQNRPNLASLPTTFPYSRTRLVRSGLRRAPCSPLNWPSPISLAKAYASAAVFRGSSGLSFWCQQPETLWRWRWSAKSGAYLRGLFFGCRDVWGQVQPNPNILRCDGQSSEMALARISLRPVSCGGWVPSRMALIISGASQLMRARPLR